MRFRAGYVTPATRPLLVAYNGTDASGIYKISTAVSTDHATWVTKGSAVISPGGVGFEATWVAQPSLVWDGSKFVIYYTGYNGSNLAIGRATSTTFDGPWTKEASNPVVPKGGVGDPDVIGAGFPTVLYDAADTPKWRMWYHGYPTGSSPSNASGLTVCYADSSDGITWTKHGTVIGVGTAGAFNDVGTDIGCVIKSGSTWYVFMSGYHDPGTGVVARSGYCTCTDPSNAATYSALSQLSNYTGNVTFGSRTWKSNLPRSIIADPSSTGYLCFPTFWNPTDTGVDPIELCSQVSSTDLTSWASPTSVMLPSETWDAHSTENPSVILAPQ